MADTEDTDAPAVESRVIIEIDEHPQLVGATGTIKKFSNDGATAWVETGPSRGVWCSVSNLRVIPPGRGGVMADTEDTETLADSIGGCFSNVTDLPEWMQAQALGRSMRPLTLIAARAVLESGWLLARDERIRADEREKLAGEVGTDDALYSEERAAARDALRRIDALSAALAEAKKRAGEVEAQWASGMSGHG